LEASTVLFIALSLLASLAIAYFQYYYKAKKIGGVTPYLFSLRALVLFLLFLLLINPTIEKTSFETQKPALSVLIDNSESVKYFKEDSLVSSFIGELKNNNSLNEKFDINYYSFGTEVKLTDSVDFSDVQTNIYEGLQIVGNLNKQKKNPIILISDGNQTVGNDYEYANVQHPVYPVIIGDTVQYEDLSIAQLNVNRYSFLNNQFPVEALLFYEGDQKVSTQFTIERNGKVVYRKQVRFSPEKRTQTVQASLKSEKKGVNFYTANLRVLKDEKNTINNRMNFSVEVIDKQSEVLILSSIFHPDLGALKKSIEQDQQRKVTINLIDSDFQIKDYQLVILYQPNQNFNKVIDVIKNEKINYFLITGSQTDWDFINNSNLGIRKNSINQSEDYGATFNQGYLIFAQKDINFSNFPPLKDSYGETRITIPHQTLLTQNISGFASEESLLATANENNHKKVYLLGEGIWKWRSASYLNSNSFNDFDEFIGNLVQYASSKKVRNRLDVTMKTIYNANAVIQVGAFYVDSNYDFDPRATLIFNVKNEDTKATKSYPLSLSSNSYQLQIESLPSGNYSYRVTVEGQNVSKKGNFKVNAFSVEEQFTNANKEKLALLADRTQGQVFSVSKKNTLLESLLNNEQYRTVQKAFLKKESIINWSWILFLIVGLLAIEWFARKYHGKI
jgi:hypothetical protein